jgi:hypothetical protein
MRISLNFSLLILTAPKKAPLYCIRTLANLMRLRNISKKQKEGASDFFLGLKPIWRWVCELRIVVPF